MKILVVGGAGYLGGSIIDLLKNTKHEFIVYDNLLYENTYNRNVNFVYGDVRDYDKINKYLKWADEVIWLAAIVGDGACTIDENLTWNVNVDSITNLTKNFKKKIIFSSTCSIYGSNEEYVNEKSKPNPLSLYAETKLQAEKLLKFSDVLIFRLGTLFGISDKFSRLRTDLVLNTLVVNAVEKGKLSVFGGNQYRPLVHVKDIAKIMVSSIGTNNKGIYNVHKINITIIELAKLIKKLVPEIKLNITSGKFEDNRNYKADSSKAIKEIFFSPQITLEDGVIEITKFLKEKRLKNPYDIRYSNHLFLKEKLGEKV